MGELTFFLTKNGKKNRCDFGNFRGCLVTQGETVKKGDIIAITTNYDTRKAQLETAKQELKVAQANLAIHG